MDLRYAGSPDRDAPPIPTRHHFHVARSSRQRSPQGTKPASIPPASPEVISNLITSLSAISQPANHHFESQPAAVNFGLPSPSSPLSGSFGVDYGAYARSDLQDTANPPTSLDTLAASPPTIRTSKPTRAYSPLTGAKSPQARSPSRDSGGSGFRNLIRSSGSITSRPSSPGSTTSKNEDTHSIGNLSIERGGAAGGPTPELSQHRAHDSWGKKTGRTTKALMYMNSKERLREQEFERKRPPGRTGSIDGAAAGASGSMNHGGKPDPFLAETAISEEPGSHGDNPAVQEKTMYGISQPVPTRESSLRRPRTKQKRSSGRRSSKPGGDTPVVGHVIFEAEEQARGQRDVPAARQQRQQQQQQQQQHKRTGSADTAVTAVHGKSFLLGPNEFPASPVSASRVAHATFDSIDIGSTTDADEGAAPFPAVAQRRRGDDKADRRSGRFSGRLSPGPREPPGLKRNSSRLKRLSGQLSPRSEPRASLNASPDPSQSLNVYPAGYERPASADSVDDAVESYLCSPRLSQKIRHPQGGRVISFSEVGDANGSAVFCCVGMGLTRYITAFYDELALTLKLRLITPDRPGVGDSESYADGATTPLSWPDDVYAICQALKITKFSILAHSAGAIYALATALRMPQHIRGRIHLLAPWIPPSQMNVFGGSQMLPPTNAIPTSQKILRALPTPLLKAANSSFMTATSSSITSSLPKNPRRTKRKSNTHAKDGTSAGNRNTNPVHDSEHGGNNTAQKKAREDSQRSEPGPEPPSTSEDADQMQSLVGGNGITDRHSTASEPAVDAMADRERQATYDTRLTHAIWESATTGANPAVDLLVCLERRHTIGFRYVDITRPVVMHHGSRDTRVPVENVKWLGKTMRRCEVRVLEGEGHGLMASATVMGSVLMEMSKEWEDWMRLTGADGRKDRERGRRGTIGRVV